MSNTVQSVKVSRLSDDMDVTKWKITSHEQNLNGNTHDFTGPGAHQAANPGKRAIPTDDVDGLGIASHSDKGYVSRNIQPGRAGHLTGRRGQSEAISRRAVMGFDMTDKYFMMLCQRRSHQFAGLLGRFCFALFLQFLCQRLHGRQMLAVGSAPGNIVQ